jgi:hypothetical protein
MRRLTIPITAVLLFAGVSWAGQDEARAILEKAIKAHGGEEVLRKHPATIIKAKGKMELFDGVEIQQTIAFQQPNKFRNELSFTINGMEIRTVGVYDGKKAAIEVNGKKADFDKLDEAFRDAAVLINAFELYPLKDKSYELTAVGEVQVNGKPAIGIRAAKKGQRDVTLYFDKTTHLLARAEHRTVDVMSGQEVTEERIITDYKKVDGIPTPMKGIINRDGKKFMEAEVIEYKTFEKLDDSQFTLP